MQLAVRSHPPNSVPADIALAWTSTSTESASAYSLSLPSDRDFPSAALVQTGIISSPTQGNDGGYSNARSAHAFPRGTTHMFKQFGMAALVGLALLWPATVASPSTDTGTDTVMAIVVTCGHSDHHDSHDDHHDSHSEPRHSDIFRDMHLSHGHHSSWHHVVPHYDRHYHGTYYFDGGINYYVPRPYVADRSVPTSRPNPSQIEFGGYAHVDDLSGRLERLANQLCLDLHYNYRHNPGFADTYREAYQILNTAKYIHDKEHQGDRAEVARRLDEVDGLFHHVQERSPRLEPATLSPDWPSRRLRLSWAWSRRRYIT